MITKKTIAVALGLILWLVTADPVDAQIVFGRKPSVQARTVFSNWKLSDDDGTTTLSQVWFHLNSYIPLRENFEARVRIFSLTNNLDDQIGKADLSGLGDCRVTLSHSFQDDRILLNFGLNLPTGKRELDPTSERRIIRALSESALDFPSRRYGQGFGFTTSLGGVRPFGKVNLGGSISYQYQGKYKPYQNANEYDPGNVLKASVTLDRRTNKVRWSLRSSYSLYSDDKSDDVEVFRQSPIFEMRLFNAVSSGQLRLATVLGYMSRGDNKRYFGDGDVLAVQLYGNEIHASTRLSYKLDPKIQVGPTVYLRLIDSNDGLGDEKIGDSWTLKLGMAAKGKLSRNHSANIEARLLTGKADDERLDLSGVQIILNYSLIF